MKLAKYLLIGVCYVGLIQIVEKSSTAVEESWPRVGRQEENKLERGSKGSDRDSGRISESTGGSTPGYFKGQIIKCQKPPQNVTGTDGIILPKNRLVIWTTTWCSACPLMKELGDKFKAEGFDVFYFDLDTKQSEAHSLGIKGVPTAIVYADGGIVERIVGITRWTRKRIEELIRRVLRKNEEEPTDYEIF